jgi:CemA family
MNRSVWTRLKQSLAAAEQWYKRTPERALSEAYEAAQAITKLEKQYSKGQTINLEAQGEGAVSTYFQTQLRKHLKTIRMRLTEYRFCSPILETDPQSTVSTVQRISFPKLEDGFTTEYSLSSGQYSTIPDSPDSPDSIDGASQTILEKLQFIDAVLTRYEPWRSPTASYSKPALQSPQASSNKAVSKQSSSLRGAQDAFYASGTPSDRNPSKASGSSSIPRSILKTASRFQRDLDSSPQTEEEVVQDFRTSRARTRAATRFLMLLIVLPLLTQQVSKSVLVSPIVDRLRSTEQVEAWVNPTVEAKFLEELATFESKLRFQNLLTETARSPQETSAVLKEKAEELKQEFQVELKEPLKNIISDLLSLSVFALLIFTGKSEIATLKSFLDEMVYGLSDSAKAFIIILVTDVFVGFHSPHGWEVIMDTIFEHFGLPANQSFINMFIATFPVMLDTVFKYWIFRYLNQISPSAVATYKNMNE